MLDDNLYDALAGMLAALKLLQTALQKETREPLAVVAGQGRGSRKPKANLQSVEN